MEKKFSYNQAKIYMDNADKDQTAQNVLSDLDLHCPQKLPLSSSVRKELNYLSPEHLLMYGYDWDFQRYSIVATVSPFLTMPYLLRKV